MKMLNRETLENGVNRIAEADLSANNVFGSAYCVWQNGEKLLEKYYGVTGLDGNQTVNKNTIFRLASMTKPVTAVAILILVDRGLVSLTDKLKNFCPEFDKIHIVSEDGTDLGESKTDVEILHLLTHTSGIGSTRDFVLTPEEMSSVMETLGFYAKAGLDFEPFTMQSYSAYAAFDALVYIIEKVTGMDYEKFLQQEIFEPCGMTDTTFIPTENQWKRVITMHNRIDGKNCVGITYPECVFETFPSTHKLGGAGLVSTLSDYSKFAQMLLNKGKTENGRIFSEKMYDLISKPHVPYSIMPDTQRWGLGVRVITEEAYEVLPVGTFGWSGAYGTHFWIDPVNKITAVFMKNSRVDGGAGNYSARCFESVVHDALAY